MRKRFSKRLLTGILAVALLALVVAPMAVQAKEFKYDKKPSFSITHPDNWAVDPENPWKVMYRVKAAAGIPILDVQVLDIPKGEKLTTIGKYWKKNIIDKEQKVDTVIVSDKIIKLPDGTEANETIYNWNYKSVVDLQTINVSVFKDGKWIYATINQTQGSEPLRKVLYTLNFKK